MSGGGKGAAQVDAPNPLDVAVTDFLFNRVDTFGPGGNTQFFGPGTDFNIPASPAFLPGINPGGTSGSTGGIGPDGLPVSSGSPVSNESVPGKGGTSGEGSSTSVDPVSGELVDNDPNFILPSGQGFSFPSNSSNAAQVTNLSPEQIFLQSLGITSEANTGLDVISRQNQGLPGFTNSINTSGLPALPGDFNNIRNEASGAFFDRGAELLNRNFGRDLEAIDQMLANRGIDIDDSEASSVVREQFFDARNDSFEQLARDATIVGGAEATRGINDTLNIRGAGFDEGVTNENLVRNARGTLFNELSSLTGRSGVPVLGAPGATAAPTNILDAFGLETAANTTNAGIDQQNKASNIGGASTAAAALIMALSTRMVKNIKGKETRFLERLDDVDIERWTYIGDEMPHIGPMAEDFNSAFNLGEKTVIHYMDMFGVALGAVKELTERVKFLEGKLNASAT